jgi:predicted Zn-dependent peptidase
MTVIERTTLPNGVRVLAAPMDHVQSTACYVMIATGSRYETTATDGAAHFVEHMLFCGTPTRPTVRALTGEVDAIGGLFNASTGKEYTMYYVKCASEYAPQALDVLADMIRNSLFEESEVEREKGVIVEEIRAKFDNPSDYVDENYELLVYGDTPLGWIRIGSEESVGALDRDTLVEFAGRYYEPSRIVVGLSGRIDDGLVQKVEELFGDLAGEPAPPFAAFEPVTNGSRVLLDTKPTDQVQLCLGFRAYPYGHPDKYAVRLLATVLGGGMSSRLTEELTMRRGLAYSIYTVALSHTDAGTMFAQGGVNVAKVDDALSTIVEELRRTADEPVPSDELEKARNYAKGRFVFSVETPQGLLMHGLVDEVVTGSIREPDTVLAALDAVTADDVQRVAREMVDRGLYLSLVGPFDDPARFEKLIAS